MRKPLHTNDRDDIVRMMARYLGRAHGLDAEEALKAVIRVLDQRVTAGQLNEVHSNLPHAMADIWTESAQ